MSYFFNVWQIGYEVIYGAIGWWFYVICILLGLIVTWLYYTYIIGD